MNAIFAVNLFDGFGTGQDMPWPRNSTDLRRFKELTSGHTVIMGSGTWNSNMPKPLPNRRNIVLSKTLKDDRCEIYNNITDLVMHLQKDESVFVIGGAKLLWLLRPYIRKIYLTRFKSSERCEIVLNTSEYLQYFKLESADHFDDHIFEIYERTM